MAIFATKKVTISTSKKGVRVSPKGKSSKKKGKQTMQLVYFPIGLSYLRRRSDCLGSKAVLAHSGLRDKKHPLGSLAGVLFFIDVCAFCLASTPTKISCANRQVPVIRRYRHWTNKQPIIKWIYAKPTTTAIQVNWCFTTEDARIKLKHLYPSIEE